MKTISEEYRRADQTHENPHYGVASVEFAPMVAEIINHSAPKTVTDYGAGELRLKSTLDSLGVTDYQYQPFDPAYPAYGDAREAD